MNALEFFKSINQVNGGNVIVLSAQPIVVQVDGFTLQMYYVRISPTGARNILRSTEYDRQRSMKASNLLFLKNQMAGNQFAPFTTLTLKAEGNHVFLIDGRHRLTACFESEKTQSFWVQFAESEKSKAKLYSVMDIGAARSNFDGLHALGTFDSIATSYRSTTVSAIRRIYSGMVSNAREKKSAEELNEMVTPWLELSRQYYETINGLPNSQYLKSSRILAVALVTLRYQGFIASEFWKCIASDDGVSQTDPRKHLIRQISDRNSFIRNTSGSQDKRSALYIAKCWELHFNNKQAHRITFDEKASVVIAGTPYDTNKQDCGV